MRAVIPALSVLLATATIAPQAHAAVGFFSFSGSGFSGSGTLTFAPNVSPKDPNPNCATDPGVICRSDPPGAFAISGITGTFSDAADGILNAKITGLVPISPANERDATFDPLVPSSLSFVDYPGDATHDPGALTYNDLLFPLGSPIDCDFPFAGTFVDVFGVAFTVEGGFIADLWGDGDLHGPGTTAYGVGVTDGVNGLAYSFDGVAASFAIPEPSTWLLMLMGFGGLGYGLRRARREVALA